MSGAAPRVGVGVFVLRDGRVLMGRRLGAHGAGSWALPGGHLEAGESVEQCAARELLEETGLVAQAWQRGPCSSDLIGPDALHYVTLFVIAKGVSGEAQRREPHKCESWTWQRWDALPQPLFEPLASLRASGWTPPA